MKVYKRIFVLIATAVLCASSLVLSSCFKNGTDKDERASGVKIISGDELVADKPLVNWEGRYEYRDEQVYLYHTATGFTVEFYGTDLLVRFNADIADKGAESRKPYYNVAIDGETLPNPKADRTFKLENGEQTVTIAEGLEYGKHTLTCLKMSEPYDAVTSVISLETDGEFLYRDIQDDGGAYRFMFVCASGGSGHGALGYSERNGNAPRTTENSSSLHAFNYLTARTFNADVQFVATSGWGVGWKENCPKSIADVLDYTGITTGDSVKSAKTTAKWDYQSWVPDVIIFNIGGNDTTKDDFNQAYYQNKAVEMVKSLHGIYPNADMIWTHTGSRAGTLAVSALTDAGVLKDGYLRVFDTMPNVAEGATGSGTYGANGHSSLKTHIDISDMLVEILSSLGYAKERENINFDDFQNSLIRF